MANLPLTLSGTVYDTDGSTPVNGATVRARNETSNEIISTTSDANGNYVLDCANFASGYSETDQVTVYVIYTNLEGSSTVNLSDGSQDGIDITLSEVADSSLINYCTVQDVYDEIGTTSTDLSAMKVIKAIQRSEARINERTGIKFVSTTVTEYYDYNQFNSFKSPEQMTSVGYIGRKDYYGSNLANKFRLNNYPVISVTGLWENNASASSADSWNQLTEQTGSGGDFVVDKDTGWVTFIDDIPRYGARAIKVTYSYGYSSVPKQVERLTILLTAKDLIRSEANSSQYYNTENISMGELNITNSAAAMATYLNYLEREIKDAWAEVGLFISDIV